MKEYKKTIDIYISLNDKVNIDIELNNSSFNKALSFRNIQYLDKLFTTSVEKGIEQGIEQGIAKNKLDVARKLLEKNVSLDIISESTGLTIEEINNLK